MRRIVASVVVLALVATGAFVLDRGLGRLEQRRPYKLVFDNAFGLTQGGDFKIAGVRAGETARFSISKERPRKAVVEVEDHPEGRGQAARGLAAATSSPQSLIGEYFVDCREGKGKPLQDGATLPVSRTSSTIPVDLVNNILRLPYRERLRLIIGELGTGLAGRPRGPRRGAAPRPSRPARDQQDAEHPGRPAPGDQEVRRPTPGSRWASSTTARPTWPLGHRGQGRRRDRQQPPRGPAPRLPAAAHHARRAAALHGPAAQAGQRPDPDACATCAPPRPT